MIWIGKFTLLFVWCQILVLRAFVSKPLNEVYTHNIRELLIPSLFPNISPYIKFARKDDLRQILPHVIRKELIWKIRDGSKEDLIEDILSRTDFTTTSTSNEAIGCWKLAPPSNNTSFKLRSYQKFKHFPGGSLLYSKISLAKIINLAEKKFGSENFNFTPQSFILPRQLNEFETAWHSTKDKFWIEKESARSRGIGLRLIKHPSEITGGQRPRVIQKYITDTFTLEGTKSHLIMYVVVTSINPLRFYMRDDLALTVGLNKYSTDTSTLNNKCIHIPNFATFYATNCSKGYVVPDRTTKERELLHAEFYEMLTKNNLTKTNFEEKIRDALIKSILASKYFSKYANQPPNYHTSKQNAFEYLSVDFAIDKYGTPYLLEFNYYPTLRVHFNGKFDKGLYSRKIEAVSGALTLAGFQLPPTLSKKAKELVAIAMNQTGKDLTFDPNLFKLDLTPEEKRKHEKFELLVNSRTKYLNTILKKLTPDDVRHLIVAEDELNRMQFYKRAYPAVDMSKYFAYIRSPYYDMLYDAYEHKFGKRRQAGRQWLAKFAQRNYHLK